MRLCTSSPEISWSSEGRHFSPDHRFRDNQTRWEWWSQRHEQRSRRRRSSCGSQPRLRWPALAGTIPVELAGAVFRARRHHCLLEHSCCSTAPNGLSNGLIWPKIDCASTASAAMAPVVFLPLSAARSFLAKQESLPAAILRWRSGRKRCVVDRFRPLRSPSRPQWVRARNQ